MWAALAGISTIFVAFKTEQLGKIALGLISSLIQCTANIFDKDIWWGEVHSSRLPSLEPELCSLDCFRQHAHLDKQCMQCSHTGKQAGRQAERNTHMHKQRECLAITQIAVISAPPQTFFLYGFPFFSPQSEAIASFWCILYLSKYLSSHHRNACQMFATTCQGGSSNPASILHLSHPVSVWLSQSLGNHLSLSVHLGLGRKPTWCPKLLAKGESLSGLWQLKW